MDQGNKRLSAVAMRRKLNVRKNKRTKKIPLKGKAKMQTNGTTRYPLKKRQRGAAAKDPESDVEISDEVEIIEEGVHLPKRLRKKPEASENQKYDADRSSEDDESAMLLTKAGRPERGKKSNTKAKNTRKTSGKIAPRNNLNADDDAVMKSDEASSDEKEESDVFSEKSDEETYEEGTSDSKSEGEELNDADAKSKQINNGHTKKNKVACGNEAAEELFRWLIHPTSPDTFFKSILDKKHLYVKRSNSNYYQGLFSSKDVDKILRENDMEYQQQIDVLSYVDGKRIPIDTDTKVYAGVVWNAYNEGNSVRLRNPQSYHKGLWKLCSLLQEYFSSPVGVNMYLTPAGSQGFPPHYDDIDAFILQIEGVKLWKVYTPKSPNEVLPRFPSVDFKEDELHAPYFQVALKPGDLLYLPRGFIHQARTPKDAHSLHLTFSTNQLNTWGDFISHGLKSALDIAMAHDVTFRESLPKDYFDYVGSAFVHESKKKDLFVKKALSLAEKALGYFPVEATADAHAVEFIHKSMPPVLNKLETSCSIHGDGACIDGKAVLPRSLAPNSKIRFIRKRAFRLVVGDEGAQLFYTLSNGRDQLEKDSLFLEVDPAEVPAVCHLLRKCPEFTQVDRLPHDDTEARLNFAQQLYDFGFLMVEPDS